MNIENSKVTSIDQTVARKVTSLRRSPQARTASAMCLLALIAASGPSPAQTQSGAVPAKVAATANIAALDATTRKEVANALATALADEYAYADLGQKMAQVIRARLTAGAYDKRTSAEDFAEALQTDARSVANDKHLRVNFDPRPPRQPGTAPSAAELARASAQNGAIRKAQILPGNIGYLEVNGVPPLESAKEAIAAAFAFLHNTDALIIDLRGNGGGMPATVSMYLSYLSEGAPYLVNTIHNRRGKPDEYKSTDLGRLSYGSKKPVFALTSRRTFSGGEEMAYDIQSFKRGLVVGETTGGGANPTGPRPLGHGFVAFVPFGYAVHPKTGTNWEGVGVKPDVAVPAEQALIEAQRLAIKALTASASDPEARAALELLSTQLRPSSETKASNGVNSIQLAGSYVATNGRTVAITQKDGNLFIEHPRSVPAARLIALGGDRYRMEGMPEGFVATFFPKDGKTQLVVELGSWPPALTAQKQ